MTFNDNANVGGNTARRRGRTAAVAGGGVAGLGGIAVLIIALLTGAASIWARCSTPRQARGAGQARVASPRSRTARRARMPTRTTTAASPPPR